MEHSKCSVGIFINRNFQNIRDVLVLIQHENDDFLVRYAHRLLKNDAGIQLTLIDEQKLLQSTDAFKRSYTELVKHYPNSVKLQRSSRSSYSYFGKYSLMLVSYTVWNQLTHSNSSMLENIPSTLIINKKPSRFSDTSFHLKPDADPDI